MRAYFAEKNGIKADGIAARQLQALRQHYTGKLKLHDVKAMFHQMRDEISWTRSRRSGNVQTSNNPGRPAPCCDLASAGRLARSREGQRSGEGERLA
jgi:hypothetical protein